MRIGYIASFVIGACGGAAGAYIWCKKKFEVKYESDIKEFKREYKGVQLETIIKEESESSVSSKVNSEKRQSDDYKSTHDIPEKIRERVDIDRVAYNKVREPYMKPDINEYLKGSVEESVGDVETAEDVLAKGEHPEDGDEEDIRLISIDEYESDNLLDKVKLLWFLKDDVLTDEFGDVIDNPIEIVGEVLDCVDTSGIEAGTEHYIYVRNDLYNVDYMIEGIDSSHKDFVEG